MRGRVLLVLLLLWPVTATAQLRIVSEDGASEVRFGILAQLQLEGREPGFDLFFRRLRLMAGGRLGDRVSFFLETGSPNLGKSTDAGKVQSLYIQDFVLTLGLAEAFNLELGLILPGGAHNAMQSAASLLALDYGPWSFLSAGPLETVVGRDYGVQARGYLLSDHLEYRLGIFQGLRRAGERRPPRVVGRVAGHVFEAPKGLFYPGTTLGKRRILSFGVSADQQAEHTALALDAFWDQPVGGDALTLQADVTVLRGSLVTPQTTTLVEVGWYFGAVKLTPFLQVATRSFLGATAPDERWVQLGLAFWPRGYGLNLKAAATRVALEGGAASWRLALQLQGFTF